MPKFFIPVEDVQGDLLTIREDAHHILHVLRKEAGDHITVCDGKGQDYECELLSATEGTVVCRIMEQHPAETEPMIEITLFQGLPKAEKMEWILQKGVEIGISYFVPVLAERSVVRLEGKKAEAKLARWNKIAQAAAKQSGRGILPAVHMPVSVKNCIETFDKYDLNLLLYEGARRESLKQILQQYRNEKKHLPKRAAIWIGPEGGWAASEVQLLEKAGAVLAGLGPRILRTETAGITAAALVLYEYDQM